jgi:hypothetical protein
MGGVGSKYPTQVLLAEDQHPVGDLGPHCQDEAFGEAVSSRITPRPERSAAPKRSAWPGAYAHSMPSSPPTTPPCTPRSRRRPPTLLDLRGVGPVVAAIVLHAWSHPGRIHSEAAFAALGGIAPLPASSGDTRRHRLNRGGDRRLNRAIYTITLTRLGHDPRTRACLARRTAQGRTKREIIRSLKRYISRELYRTLTAIQPRPAQLGKA